MFAHSFNIAANFVCGQSFLAWKLNVFNEL
jgi:hypothetical protein